MSAPRQAGALAYSAPFLVFVACLAVERLLPFSPAVLYPARLVLVLLALAVFSRDVIPWRPSAWSGSIGLGVAHAGMPRSFFFRGQWFF